MAAQNETRLAEPALPAGAGADGRRVVEQAVLCFLLGRAGEFSVERVIGVQERLLAVQDRRVGAGGIVVAFELPRAQ
jgi:hypothetical protein